MPISPLTRSVTHFQNLKDRNEKMKAVDFDDQFALVADYLNTSVVPVINQLIAQKVPGSNNPADINKFFRNVGDGTVEWASIGNDAIQDFTLELRKLSRSNPGTILASGANRAFTEVTPTAEGEVLISQAGTLPVWQKLRSANVEDRQITSEKIALATLTNDNFQNGILTTQLLDNSVTADKIANKTLQTDKFQDGLVDENAMGNLLTEFTGVNQPNRRLYLWGNVLPDNFITTRAYMSFASVSIQGPNKLNSTHLAPNFKIPASKLTIAGLFSDGINMRHFNNQIIASYQIADNSLNASYRLVHSPTGTLSRNINDLIADGAIEPRHLPPGYRTILGL
jgi:hypothetical protein